jgi:hypothetical protein
MYELASPPLGVPAEWSEQQYFSTANRDFPMRFGLRYNIADELNLARMGVGRESTELLTHSLACNKTGQ